MAEEEYELVDSDDFKNVKQDLEKIKKNPFITKGAGEDLKNSMDGLRDSLSQMIQIFQKASDEMTVEEKEERMIARQIKPVFAKIDKILQQNETIADGMVAVAEKAENTRKQVEQLENQMNGLVMKVSQINAQQAMQQKQSSLPPLQGGPQPPSMPEQSQPPRLQPDLQQPSFGQQQNISPPSKNMPYGPMPPPPGSSIPPLDKNELEDGKKHHFSLFKK